MTQNEVHQPATEPVQTVESRWADLADLALMISREIQVRGYTDERALLLSPSEGVVIRYLCAEPVAPPSRIAEATGIQRTNLSAVLRGLEDKGLIERTMSPDDRRGIHVHLTARGRANYALVRREWAAATSAAADDDTTDLDATISLLAAVHAGMVRARSTVPADDHCPEPTDTQALCRAGPDAGADADSRPTVSRGGERHA